MNNKEKETIIKSTSSSIKFANREKQAVLVSFIDEYKNVVSNFVNLIWDMDKILILLPKEITSKVEQEKLEKQLLKNKNTIKKIKANHDQKRWKRNCKQRKY